MVAGSAKVYRGPDGIRVALVGLQDGSFLVRVTGTSHRLDGKVIRCKLTVESAALHLFSTPYDGHDLRLLKRVTGGGQGVRYLVNLPGDRFVQDLPVEYDEAASAALKPEELVAAHEAQVADGTLGALIRFDVQGRIRLEEEGIGRDVELTNRACGSRLTLQVDWDALGEKTQKSLAVRSPCDEILSALRQFCAEEPVREVVQKHLKEVRCRVEADDRVTLRLEGRTLHYATGRRAMNRHLTVRRVLAEQVRWPGGENLAQRIFRAQTQFCTDGKGNFVGWRPSRAPEVWTGYARRLFFGTAQKLTEVPENNAGEAFFYDPRYYSRGSGWGSMGHRSVLRWDQAKRQCMLHCGTRRVELQVMAPAEVQKTLAGAAIAPPFARREPHGLARDRAGTYYYVDKAGGEGAKDFRLYRGPLGRMTLQRMVNIVSDSEGEVYSTKTGALRLVLEREHSYWEERGKKVTLVNVPIAKNLLLIFNDLGVYMGKPFGTPCDLF